MAGSSTGFSASTAPCEVFAGCWRLCSLAPIATLAIIVALYSTTLWSGWIDPVGLVWHGPTEMLFFTLEVFLLIASYTLTIFRGPGFVALGWKPTPEEIERHAGLAEQRPLDVVPSASDCLQFCQRCQGFKPPRAHHCSTCGRCVLWMDHHCPWTNTCIGYRNLRSFTQFTHYVTLACLHSFYIQSEAVIRLGLLLYNRKHGRFWRFFSKERTIFALISWLADLLITILVGSLAWDMHWTLGHNVTMVEEMIVERAEVHRTSSGDRSFEFPYDLGVRGNWKSVMGGQMRYWFLPFGEVPGDGTWPSLREGCGHFDLSSEQLAQRALWLSRSVVMPIVCSYDGNWSCVCTTVCRCYYWSHMTSLFGCGTACSGPGCDEMHLTVREGDEVMVSYREEFWIMGRVLPPDSDGPDGPEGWFPCLCADIGKARKFEVPHQKQLQGKWLTRAGPVSVNGPVVTMEARQGAYVFRADSADATLLGCRLQQCDGHTAKWSSGDVWHRPESKDLDSDDAAEAGRARFRRRVVEARAMQS